MRTQLCLVTFLALVSGCGKDEGGTQAPAAPALTGPAAVEAMKSAGTALAAKPEHGAERVEVQHLLIAFQGAERATATRSKQEAEVLAAELYARVLAGEDLDGLVRQYTDDSHPGIYAMSAGAPTMAGEYPRAGMAAAFGDTGWRLAVGEVGVALYDPDKSPFGWHIIKRTR
jgi:parvulin-like peptidyl-prolyl isomerase